MHVCTLTRAQHPGSAMYDNARQPLQSSVLLLSFTLFTPQSYDSSMLYSEIRQIAGSKVRGIYHPNDLFHNLYQ